MNYYWNEDAEFVNGSWVNLSKWFWEDGREVDETELCEKCGKPVDGTYRDDCIICEDCAVNMAAGRD